MMQVNKCSSLDYERVKNLFHISIKMCYWITISNNVLETALLSDIPDVKKIVVRITEVSSKYC